MGLEQAAESREVEARHCPHPKTDPAFDAVIDALVWGQHSEGQADSEGLVYRYQFRPVGDGQQGIIEVCDWKTNQRSQMIGSTACHPILDWVGWLATIDPESDTNKRFTPTQIADGLYLRLLSTIFHKKNIDRRDFGG